MSKRKSRLDFDQAEFYKRSHDAMYVEIDGKQYRLNKGDLLSADGRQKLNELRGEKGKEKPEPESQPVSDLEACVDLTVAGLVDDFLASVASLVKRGKLASRTYDWYDDHLQRFGKYIGTEISVSQFKKSHVKKWLDKDYPSSLAKRLQLHRLVVLIKSWKWNRRRD